MTKQLMDENFFAAQREKLGLTQKAIADALEYESYAAVSAWERDVAAPDLNEAENLARIYKVSRTKMIDEILILKARIKAAKNEVATK